MTIRWITSLLGTAPALTVTNKDNLNVIDVRELVDKAGNSSEAISEKIHEGCQSLRAGYKTIVCCDYGISRSNAIAVGILSVYQSIPFEAAVRQVLEATGEKEIKAEPLHAVRLSLGEREKEIHDKSRLLITGATGFIGRAVNSKLSEEFTVFSPSRKELDLQLGTTQLDLFIGEHQIDRIIHLANPRIFTSNVALGETLTMLRNVIDICVARNITLVFMSGWEVYSGYNTNNLKANEHLPLLPKGPYGETKYLCEQLIENSRKTQGLQCAMLRSGPVYGVGGEKPKFIYNFIDKIKSCNDIVTHQYLNGFPSLDLMYIDDLVLGIYKTIKSNFIGNLNLGTGVLTTTKDVAEKLNLLLCGKSNIRFNYIDSYTACIAIDNSGAKEKIGWEPTTDLDLGLRLIISELK